jgi:outer membrane protein OmpA-like peptidoglycan-associated protein
MRSIIIGLSVIFFSLSVIVILMALDIPSSKTLSQDSLPEIAFAPPIAAPATAPALAADPESADLLNDLVEDQHTSQIPVEDTQETIVPIENQSATTKEILEDTRIKDTEIQSRTLATFGGKTFRSGQDVIHDVPYSIIENLVREISASPGSRILIEGHTDNIPTGKLDSDNMDLSYRRARAIANILILHGIPKERISVTGYGDTRPADSNNTEEGRAKNRRVEVKLMSKEGAN